MAKKKKDKIYDGSVPEEIIEVDAHGEDAPEASASFRGTGDRAGAELGVVGGSDNDQTQDTQHRVGAGDRAGAELGVTGGSDADTSATLDEDLARIADEVMAMSGLGEDDSAQKDETQIGSETASDAFPVEDTSTAVNVSETPAGTFPVEDTEGAINVSDNSEPTAKSSKSKKPSASKRTAKNPDTKPSPSGEGGTAAAVTDEGQDLYEAQDFDFDDEEQLTLFGSDDDEQPTILPIILFEDVDDDELLEDEQPVVLFSDVDDTYLNQVDLVDRRLEMLRKESNVAAPVDAPEPEETTGVIQFVDEEEAPLGKNLLDADVDTLIKQLLRQSKKREGKIIPIEDLDIAGLDTSYLDYKGDEPDKSGEPGKAEAIREIDEMLKNAGSDPILYNLYSAVTNGQNKLTHSLKSEAITLDAEWITTIEDGLYFIEDIVKNPRKFIIDNEIIMEVERARKTTSKTVRHLAQNTRNISKIDDDGFVTPKKVLTVEMEEDLAIYENRFICTLINRLTAFVESRKADIQDKFRMYDISQVTMNSKFKYGPGEVECNFSVAIKEPPKDHVLLDKAMYLVGKINDVSKRLRILRNSSFVKQLSGYKPIVPPIAKTNIIKMNVNYSTCYKLWLFISAYTMVGYSVEVREKKLPIGGNYYDDLTALTSLSMRTLIDHELVNREQYAHIQSKPARSRRYKVVPDYSFAHTAKDKSVTVQDEAVNEYYFRKIQELFEEKVAINPDDEEEAVKQNNTVTETRKLNMNYERYAKSLIKVSNDLISDSIAKEEKPTVVHVSAVKRKKRELEEQKETLKKYSTIARVKAADLEKTLMEEVRLELKLDKLSRELEVLEAREKRRRIKPKKAKPTKAELNRKQKAEQKAAEYKQELLDKMTEEQLEAERKKEEKKEQRQRERELKLLEQLKEKYDKE